MLQSRPSLCAVILAFLTFWTLATQPTYAYLDPGTGSYLFQIALASLFGALFGLKLYWVKVKTFMSRLLGKSAPTPDKSQEKTDA